MKINGMLFFQTDCADIWSWFPFYKRNVWDSQRVGGCEITEQPGSSRFCISFLACPQFKKGTFSFGSRTHLWCGASWNDCRSVPCAVLRPQQCIRMNRSSPRHKHKHKRNLSHMPSRSSQAYRQYRLIHHRIQCRHKCRRRAV